MLCYVQWLQTFAKDSLTKNVHSFVTSKSSARPSILHPKLFFARAMVRVMVNVGVVSVLFLLLVDSLH